ncbi:MAG: glycosyltransferase family A protein [Bacteroidota bacterium]|nr:glycosyltransferase family A protein [Bacteroidota bacterium]
MEKARISVIIPVYNAEKYLSEAIESVIAQKVDNMEIIVVDDGSTDNSAAIAESFSPRIKIIRQSNKGAGAARNKGVALANGNFLAFIDADDLWSKDKLKKQIALFKQNPSLDITFGNVEQFVSPELSVENKNRLRNELKIMPGYSVGAMLIQKETFLRVGFFNEKLELGEFIDWFSRAKDMGLNFTVSEDIVLKRRIHNSNMGVYKRDKLKDYTTVLRAALARKRMNKPGE